MLQDDNDKENKINKINKLNPSRFIKLDVRGEVFEIIKSVGSQIPFIEVLIDSTDSSLDANPTEPIIIDEVSPLFFRILTDFLKNQEHVDIFKEQIARFERKNVQYWLKYLCMDKLFKTLYGCESVNGKKVIFDVEFTRDTHHKSASIYTTYTTVNENYNVPSYDTDENNMLVFVSAYECTEGKDKGYMVIPKSKNGHKTFFHQEDIVENDGFYFITFKNAIRYNILSDRENVDETN